MNVDYSQESAFDKQGRYFWYLVRDADWDQNQVAKLMLKKYKKSHWNILMRGGKLNLTVGAFFWN
jgi:hypothetical protein